MKRDFTLILSLFLCFATAALTSCKKFEGGQSVPSYLRIDAINLDCDYNTFGANTNRFIDAWVYIDGDDRGCYELPALVPVLKKGPHEVKVYAGIAANGIKNSRALYPFTSPATFSDVNLVPDSIVTLAPTVRYEVENNPATVYWKENFDGGTYKMEANDDSDASIIQESGPLAWHDPLGFNRSAKLVLHSDTAQFCITTSGKFTDFPSGMFSCMLEMDYKCSDTCAVGYIYKMSYTNEKRGGILRLKPTGVSGEEPVEWNKIYITLGPYFDDYKDADYFKIYLSSWDDRNEGDQYFYFDNLKIIYMR